MSKLLLLKKWFEDHQGTVTAFSGGVDSSLVLFVSHMVLGDKALGLISNSESLKSRDFGEAISFCESYGIQLEVVKTAELSDPNYTANPANRCFFCKNHLYETMVDLISEHYPTYTILNGTNKDDLGDYRPGLQAAKLHRIRSPLAELEISKKEVIEMANHLGLPNAYKPPSPCLSSRIPYGTEVNSDRLRQIEEAEYVLNSYGFFQVRVRYRGKTASVEVPNADIEKLQKHIKEIEKRLQEVGFSTVEVDMEGFVSGKLNRVLNE